MITLIVTLEKWEKRKRQEKSGKKRKRKQVNRHPLIIELRSSNIYASTLLHPSCQVLTEEELEELSRDARLLKKFKSGKISEAELDRQLELSSHHPKIQ